MSGVFGLLFSRLTLPAPSAIQGKTILITGANTGLGREAARHALALGAGTVILGVRSLSKGEDAKANIDASTGCTDKGKVLVWPIDLESFASVQGFAARVRKYVTEGGRLDMAIMNAGIASVTYAVTRDGWERGIQVNVLSTALLSLELLPLLLRTKERDSSSQPHLTIVTSDIHKSIKFPERNEQNILSALNDEKQWRESQAVGGATERYGVTKLMDLFITFEIAQLVPRDKSGNPLVIVNAVAPGFCKSDLLSREKVPLILKLIQALIARTAEEGSKTLLHAASQGAETHGKWLDNQIITEYVVPLIGDVIVRAADMCFRPGNIITSPEAAVLRKKLWAEILSVLHDVNPEIQTEY